METSLFPRRVSRRQMLRYSAGALLASSMWPGHLWADETDATDFRFIAINDLHYTDARCQPYFEKLVEVLKTRKDVADFILLEGDLSEDGTPEQLVPVRDLMRTLGMPVYVVPGNHDHLKDNTRKPYQEAWPNSINYTFDHRGWQLIGLDTSEGNKSQTTCQKPTFDWLDENLPRIDKHRPIILFTHFPLGLATPYRVSNADDLLARFGGHNLVGTLSGHFHGYTIRTMGKVSLTTNKCCSFRRGNHDKTPEKGYFLCKASGGVMTREFVEFKFS